MPLLYPTKNGLKHTYDHVQSQKIFRGVIPPDPAYREGEGWKGKGCRSGGGKRIGGKEREGMGGKGRRLGGEGRIKCRERRGGEGRGGEGMRGGRWVGGVLLHALGGGGDRRH
jgi:hypothetical protein